MGMIVELLLRMLHDLFHHLDQHLFVCAMGPLPVWSTTKLDLGSEKAYRRPVLILCRTCFNTYSCKQHLWASGSWPPMSGQPCAHQDSNRIPAHRWISWGHTLWLSDSLMAMNFNVPSLKQKKTYPKNNWCWITSGWQVYDLCCAPLEEKCFDGSLPYVCRQWCWISRILAGLNTFFIVW